MKLKMTMAVAAALVAIQSATPALQAQSRKFQEMITVTGGARHGGNYALTFSGPVALPGLSLGAGTYIFRQWNHSALQVTSPDGTPYAMFLTIPAIRTAPTDGYSIVLGPPAAPESPNRIVAVFAPGETTGQQFVYPAR